MKFFKKWLENKRVAEFQNGYEFAAGILLKRGQRPGVLLDLKCKAENPWDYPNTFDEGVLSAIKDYEKLLGTIDYDH